MEKLLIEIHLFVCHVYDISSATYYQRLSAELANRRERCALCLSLLTQIMSKPGIATHEEVLSVWPCRIALLIVLLPTVGNYVVAEVIIEVPPSLSQQRPSSPDRQVIPLGARAEAEVFGPAVSVKVAAGDPMLY